MSDGNTRIRVKIGSSEFDAEGPTELVRQQYDEFLKAVSSVNLAASVPSQNLSAPPPANPNPSQETPPDAVMQRIFSIDQGVVSLLDLPKTQTREADALLLILYGYRQLKNETSLLGSQLMKAANKSGLDIDRIDRVIDRYDEMLMKSGKRRGIKYGLKNRGMAKAKELYAQIAELHQ